jgi:hypothetical protein
MEVEDGFEGILYARDEAVVSALLIADYQS